MILIFNIITQFYFLISVPECSHFSISSQHLSLSDFFLIVAILVGMKWYLTVVWLCISLKPNCIKHIFMYLLLKMFLCVASKHLKKYISFLRKCLLTIYSLFKLGYLTLLSCESPLYSLYIKPLSGK